MSKKWDKNTRIPIFCVPFRGPINTLEAVGRTF